VADKTWLCFVDTVMRRYQHFSTYYNILRWFPVLVLTILKSLMLRMNTTTKYHSPLYSLGSCPSTTQADCLDSPLYTQIFISLLLDTNDTSAQEPNSLVPAKHAEDDTAVRNPPSRYVDYLSHDWEEEDIWSSWKHIESKRNVYDNSARLQNALWRTWTRSKYRLKTVFPETLNW
jgi:hypothetical protein